MKYDMQITPDFLTAGPLSGFFTNEEDELLTGRCTLSFARMQKGRSTAVRRPLDLIL
jgi:hypothetical protein